MSVENASINLPHARGQLLKIPLVAKLPETLRERLVVLLLWIGHEKYFGDGAYIYVEGKSDLNSGCILLDGKVSVEKDEKVVEIMEAPDIIGEAQQFTSNRERTASVRAMGASLTLMFSWPEIGTKSARIFSSEERHMIKNVIRDLAWERCAELFDAAAMAAQLVIDDSSN